MIGYSLAVVGVAIAVVQGGLIGVVTKKFGAKKCIFIGLTFHTIGFFLFSMASAPWMMFAIVAVYAFGGISLPNIQGILSSQVPSNEQGELQGGITSLISVTAVIGPLLMTGSFTFFTKDPQALYFPGIPFFIGGILTLFCFMISYFVLKKLTVRQ
jgi:DHA1 family tetracycline resistance protein-like MFS transporter